MWLVKADKAQEELRILAQASGDVALTEAFRERGDIHFYTATQVFQTEAIQDASMLLMRSGLPTDNRASEILLELCRTYHTGAGEVLRAVEGGGGRGRQGQQYQEQEPGYTTPALDHLQGQEDLMRALREYQVSLGTSPRSEQRQQSTLQLDYAMQILSPEGARGLEEFPEWKARRSFGKNVNFALVYGASAPRLLEMAAANGLLMSANQAQSIMRSINNRFSGVESYRQQVINEVLTTHATRTLFGRERRFDSFGQMDSKEKAAALREAFNHTIQGTAADIFKAGLVMLQRDGMLDDDHRLVNLVHDEYVFYIPEGDTNWLQQLKATVEGVTYRQREWLGYEAVDWMVLLKLEISVGKNWAETTALDI